MSNRKSTRIAGNAEEEPKDKKQKTSHLDSREEIALLKETVASLQTYNKTLHRVIGERNKTKNLILDFQRQWDQERECANITKNKVQEELHYINTHLIETRNHLGFLERDVEPLKETVNRVVL